MYTGTSSKKSKTEVLFVPKRDDTSNSTDLSPILLSKGTQKTFHEPVYLPRFDHHFGLKWWCRCKPENRQGKLSLRFPEISDFYNPFIPLKIKQYFYVAITVNLWLWGNECWALSSNMLRKLEFFHSKCCRAILGTSMWAVSMYKVRNIYVLTRLRMPPMENFIHYRRLLGCARLLRRMARFT